MQCALGVEERRFARQLYTFLPSCRPRWIVEFDASLSGIGIIVYRRELDGEGEPTTTEVPVGYCVVDIGVLGFGCDASFQNTSEFIGALLGVRAARICNADMSSLELRGGTA